MKKIEDPVTLSEADLRRAARVHNLIRRELRPFMSAHEYCVLDYLVDRTLGQGRVWERVSFSQMMQGKDATDGQPRFPPLGLTHRTLRLCLDRLTESRIIVTRPTEDGEEISISEAVYAITPDVIAGAIA